jgi:hypothetical protein
MAVFIEYNTDRDVKLGAWFLGETQEKNRDINTISKAVYLQCEEEIFLFF